MRTYLYSGTNKSRDLARLAAAATALRLPIYLASFGPPPKAGSLASHTEELPIDSVRVRLPGWGLPRTSEPLAQMAVQTNLAVLRAIIASGDYGLVILDGIRDASKLGRVTSADLRRLVRAAPKGVEIAMT